MRCEIFKMKRNLEIQQLKSIDTTLGTDLDFIEYSTQKRNLAYLLQLREFLLKVDANYVINRGLASIFHFNILRINSDIIESLLFCFLVQIKAKIHKGRKAKIIRFINAAKTAGAITKNSAEKAEMVVNFRNKFHPIKQVDLHTKIDPKVFQLSNEVISELMQDIKHYCLKIKRRVDVREQLKKDYLRRRNQYIRALLEDDEDIYY